MNRLKKNNEVFKKSCVSKLNNMCRVYNEMVKNSVRSIWFNDNMEIVMSTPAYTQEELDREFAEIMKEYYRSVKELEDE